MPSIIESKVPSIIGSATTATAALNAIENKTPKYQTWSVNVSPHLIIINLQMLYLKERYKNKKSVNKSDISAFINNTNSCSHSKHFSGDNGFHKIFIYQPKFGTLELKRDKDTDCVIDWKSKGLFKSKLLTLHGALIPNV